MKLTEAAAQRVAELTKRADSEIVGLRVGIKNGGCAGHSRRMARGKVLWAMVQGCLLHTYTLLRLTVV